MAKFSVIIPVYNAEEFLLKATDSILKQSYRDLELVLVDDGSRDGSPALCDSIAEKDSRVVVLHKPNGGAASARNEGIRLAKGDYVSFLDSDDYWDDLEILQKVADKLLKTDADLVEGRLKEFDYSSGAIRMHAPFPDTLQHDLPLEEALRILVSSSAFKVHAGLKFIRRQFILEHDLFFPVGVTCEDILWAIRIIAASPKYACLNAFYYCYRSGRPGSVTSNIREKNIEDYLYVLNASYKAVSNAPEELKESLYGYLLYQCIVALALVANLSTSKPKKADYRRQLRNLCLEDLKKKALNPKARKAQLVYKLFGFRIMVFVLGRYLKVR